MTEAGLYRWTRDRILNFPWNTYESFDHLVIQPTLKEHLQQVISHFKKAEAEYAHAELPWRYGVFFFGPTGSGKTAASRGLAHALQWPHFTIPAHEILDSHFLERALADAVSHPHRVIDLEDVDVILSRMESEVFFSLLDNAMERSKGHFWVATTRHAEDAPKTQLLRPGRFDESIRVEYPKPDLRRILLATFIREMDSSPEEKETLLNEWVELSEGLSFFHFSELRQIFIRMQMEKQPLSERLPLLRAYIEDQMIIGDRLGKLSDEKQRLEERIQQVDARVLTAALDMTDVLRTLMEKVIGDAMEQGKPQSGLEKET